MLSQALIFSDVVRPSNTFENETKWSGLMPTHLGRGAEVLEHVLEVFSPRTAPRPEAKNALPFSGSKLPGHPFLYISLEFSPSLHVRRTSELLACSATLRRAAVMPLIADASPWAYDTNA